MKKIDNIFIKRFAYFNVYVIKGNDGDILIDTGFIGMRKFLKKWLDNFNIKLIILTHAHIDHIWNVKYLKDIYNVKVAIGEKDKQYLNNSLIHSKPKSNIYKQRTKLMNYGMRKLKQEKFDIDIILKDEQEIDEFGIKLKIIDLPGHTYGSIGIQYKNYLFCGDALVNRKHKVEIAYQNQNNMLAKESALKIFRLKPSLIFIGHERAIKYKKLKKSISNITKGLDNNYRMLDNSAKLFPLVINKKKYNGYFRITVSLKETINTILMKEAVEQTLNELTFLRVKLVKSLFWHHFEFNENEFEINNYNYSFGDYFDLKKNNQFLFKVSCINNYLYIDFLHYLCDGNSAKKIFEFILNKYMNLLNKPTLYSINSYSINDDYLTYFTKYENCKIKNEKVNKNLFIINGTTKGNNITNLSRIDLDIKKLNKIINKYNCTITEFLCATLIYSIKRKEKCDKTVSICLPVNLRNYFNSDTLNNFFSFVYINSSSNDLNTIIKEVVEQFNKKLTKEVFLYKIYKQVKLTKRIFIYFLPIFFKRIIIQLTYWHIAKNATMILSNFGEFKTQNDVDYFETIIEPDPTKLIKCSFCSYNGVLKFVFSSKIKEKNIEDEFISFLKELDIIK